MREIDKLDEAKFFYSKMKGEKDSRQLKYYLSAFLSAARSVLQYAREKAKLTCLGQRWYDLQMQNSRVVKFFKEKRDINIHIEPVSPIKQINVGIIDRIPFSDSVTISQVDSEGNTKELFQIESEPEVQQPPPQPTIEEKWRFDDWHGNEDMFALCQQYLSELERMVEDGRQQGFPD